MIIVTHEYDKFALYLTVPLIYESDKLYSAYTAIVLEQIKTRIQKFSVIDPPQDMLVMDKTCRYPWGKLMIHVRNIEHFPYCGNVLVRFTLQPWKISSRKLQKT